MTSSLNLLFWSVNLPSTKHICQSISKCCACLTLCLYLLLLILRYYEHSLHVKAYLASDNRTSQGWDIICSPLSISRYLQIQRNEISFSVRHQGINDIFTMKSITVSSFSDCQKDEDITMKTLQGDEEMKRLQCPHFLSNITHDLITYVCIIVWY